jgi:hypothetical protein
VRAILFIVALAVARYEPGFLAFRQRLPAAGKSPHPANPKMLSPARDRPRSSSSGCAKDGKQTPPFSASSITEPRLSRRSLSAAKYLQFQRCQPEQHPNHELRSQS